MNILKEYIVKDGDLKNRAHKYVTQQLNLDSNRNPIIASFDKFFPTNPKCTKASDGKPIGLDPKAFE